MADLDERAAARWRWCSVTLSISRFESSLQRWPRLVERCFSAQERAYAARHRRPAQHLAARFAAKQALRALMGPLPWASLCVQRDERGAPSFVLHGRAAARCAASPIVLSLSHDADLALAWVGVGPERAHSAEAQQHGY